MNLLRNTGLFALATSALAFPSSPVLKTDVETRVVQKLPEPPAGWKKDKDQAVDKDAATVTLRIHLKQQDMDKFHDLAMKVSHPTHYRIYKAGNHRAACRKFRLHGLIFDRLQLRGMNYTDHIYNNMSSIQ